MAKILIEIEFNEGVADAHDPQLLVVSMLAQYPIRRMLVCRPMTGFLATLTPEQLAMAMAYEGPEY